MVPLQCPSQSITQTGMNIPQCEQWLLPEIQFHLCVFFFFKWNESILNENGECFIVFSYLKWRLIWALGMKTKIIRLKKNDFFDV